MKPRGTWIRPAVCLLAIALFCSGCVYLRLLQLKNQLSDFPNHFTVETTQGVRVICRDPVLLDDDLRWLGIEPQKIEKTGADEHWYVRWVKDPPAGVVEKSVYDVELEAELANGRLKTAQIPERYFEFVSKDLFVAMLRSTGAAHIDRGKRRAEVKTVTTPAESPAKPGLESIERMLGLPTGQTVADGLVRCRYRYRPITSSGGRGKPIEVTFVFTETSGELRRIIGKLPKGTVNFELAGSPAK